MVRVLHKQMTVQMLDLVTEAAGRQCLILHLEKCAVPVLSPDPHRVGTGHHAILSRNAEAALQAGLFAVGGDDLGVHQFNDLVILVHHHAHPAQNAHLGCGQTYAAGIQQRVLQVVQQRVEPTVELRHRAALFRQAGLPLQHDISQCHGHIPLFNPLNCNRCKYEAPCAPAAGQIPS